MLVFHIDESTRAFRGRSSTVSLPPSRRRALKRGARASIPAHAVVNAPPEPAADGHQWIASTIDRSEPSFPRAIWRQVPVTEPEPQSLATSAEQAAPQPLAPQPLSAESMAILALTLLLTRGEAKALARGEALALLRRWITQQGGDASGRLNAEIEALLKEGMDVRAKDRRSPA